MAELHVMVPWGPCFPFFLNPPIALQKLNFYTLNFLIFTLSNFKCQFRPMPTCLFSSNLVFHKERSGIQGLCKNLANYNIIFSELLAKLE
jgi:hypothetical protein